MTEATQEIAGGDVWEGDISVAAVATNVGRRSRRSAAVMNGLGSLAEVIEREIAPRLARRQRTGNPAFCRVDAPIRIGASAPNDSVMALADLVLGSDITAARNYVERKQRSEGASLESLYVDLLTPVARLPRRPAGRTTDVISREVTFGLGHLQAAAARTQPDLPERISPDAAERSDSARARTGEQHTFGLSMVAEFFDAPGWDVWGGPLTARRTCTDRPRGLVRCRRPLARP